jgi:unsaturated rhamnogalacturonyl hydrolase
VALAFALLAAHAGGSAETAKRALRGERHSERAAQAAMARWPDGRFASPGARWVWNYELGTLLMGVDGVWRRTAEERYIEYIRSAVDPFIGPDGAISTYDAKEYQLDSVLLGRQLLLLYGVAKNEKYAKAATLLYEQLQHQPRTASGGFWHKQRYPNQMWLDGLYMAEPFYAEYAATFHHHEAVADIGLQFRLIDEHARDAKTGLLRHGWDESRQQRWADKETGQSAEAWARAMGWMMMALVDTLDYLPEGSAERKELLAQLERDAAAVVRYQDKDSGLWWQVMDQGGKAGNYFESSASCMFVYALAKGIRRGYLPERYRASAKRGWKGILERFVEAGPGNDVTLKGTVKVGGLGGEPYRAGTFEYYISEPVVRNDPKGVGAFILAGGEMEKAGDTARNGPDLSGSWPTTMTVAVLQDEGLVPKGFIDPALISKTRLASELVGEDLWNQIYIVRIKQVSGESVQAIANINCSSIQDMNMGPVVYLVSKVLQPEGKPEPAKR